MIRCKKMEELSTLRKLLVYIKKNIKNQDDCKIYQADGSWTS